MEVERRSAIWTGNHREIRITLRDVEIERMKALLKGRWDPFSEELLRRLDRA